MTGRSKWKNPSGSRAYYAWRSMLSRCRNPQNAAYKHYGGRGISVCPQWFNYDRFYEDMGEAPPNLTLDRIDTDGNYCPENCRWATVTEQLNNQRRNRVVELDGRKLTVGQWAALLGIRYDTLHRRLGRMPPARALSSSVLRAAKVHGSRGMYEAGCRCPQCKETHNARMRDCRARKKLDRHDIAGYAQLVEKELARG